MLMFVIEVPGFSLHDTFKSNQSLMWDMRFTLDGVCYIIVNDNHSCKVSQTKNRLLVSGSEEDFFAVWFPYFDLGTDYVELDKQAMHLCYPIAKAAKCTKGVHMLNVNPLESMLTQALWWKCDAQAAKAKLKTVCKIAGTHKKKNYKEIGSIEHCYIPTYDEVMDHEKLLEDILSPRDFRMVVSLYEWFEGLRCHLIASKGYDNDIKSITMLLEDSALFKPAQIARILRDAYGVRDHICAPKRMWKQVSDSMWLDDEEEVDEEINSVLHGKAAYAGLLMQSAYGV